MPVVVWASVEQFDTTSNTGKASIVVLLTLNERTTLTGSPFWQDTSRALFILSKVWSKD